MCIRDSNTPTVDELEAKVKAGEQISLVDLAEAIKADKELSLIHISDKMKIERGIYFDTKGADISPLTALPLSLIHI